MKKRKKIEVEGKSDRKKEIKRLRVWAGPQCPETQLAIGSLY